MTETLIVFAYLLAVLYIGVFAFRRPHKEGAEDYFLAGRSLGPFVFLLSLFGTNMTAFAILGSSGHAFQNGIVTFPLMASSSALVVSLSLFLLGPRMWSLGKRFGFITPVQLFRDRWQTSHIGTLVFAVQACLLVPYIVIGVMGGGTALQAISGGRVPYWLGGLVVALVVMSYVFLGGMRGTAWVNTFQTLLYLGFGAIAMTLIAERMGGFANAAQSLLAEAATAPLLTRERVSPAFYLSYTFVPLSSIAFPHIAIFCLTARRVSHFRRTVVLYPLCMLAVWLPAVLLGVMANRMDEVPAIHAKLEARQALAAPGLAPEQRAPLRAQASGDDVLLRMLDHYAPAWLAGLLGAGVMAAVMASDSQILALSTMFTEDVFAHYGGKRRFGERAQVAMGRAFVVVLTAAAYAIALRAPSAIFDLAVQYAFAGYASLSPLIWAALFWKGSTKWGALAVTVWTALAVAGVGIFQALVPPPAQGATVIVNWLGLDLLARTGGGTAVLGMLPVVPMTLVSIVLMAVVSTLTPKPAAATLERYFES